ncbi:acetone carboxylase subunit gamma [Tistrella bauzanensis]|jgi:acetone carboxylase gamma subunit|uniref:Acetone carboxylase subunit gamma n=1 Tax=Tistrella arctica TaxID=3133430 RepID=A0ABU9YE17_9PROT
MSNYTKKQVADLVDGRLDWDVVHRMLSSPKDADRFVKFIAVLQERAAWPDRILLPLGPHLFIVQDQDKAWKIKCGCGHVFCDHDRNWKLEALVHVRETVEAMNEVYPKLMAPDPSWQVYREYCCPSCGVLLDVEAPTPWYPVLHDFEPDIPTFYKDWLGLDVPERAGA